MCGAIKRPAKVIREIAKKGLLKRRRLCYNIF
ncbi:PolB1-binding protein PBP2 family protein [Sellimonas intestinalis]